MFLCILTSRWLAFRGRWYRPSAQGIEAAPQYSANADYVRGYVNQLREKEGFGGERC